MTRNMQIQPLVFIALLNWNNAEDTIDCLDSLSRITYTNTYVAILDNASSDNSLDKIIRWISRQNCCVTDCTYSNNQVYQQIRFCDQSSREGIRKIFLVRSPVNLGFCCGNNILMSLAEKIGADYILVLNNDTVCERSFLELLIATAQKYHGSAILGGLICFAEKPDKIWAAGAHLDYFLNGKNNLYGQPAKYLEGAPTREVNALSGCMMLLPISIYKAIGGYDEDYFIWSEDWDLSIRAKRAGYRIVFVPSSRIYHKWGKSLGVMNPLSYYYGTRNRMMLARKHLEPMRRWLFLCLFIPSRFLRYAYFALIGRRDLIYAGICAVKDYWLHRSGKWEKHVG